jgi:hypothetical protein
MFSGGGRGGIIVKGWILVRVRVWVTVVVACGCSCICGYSYSYSYSYGSIYRVNIWLGIGFWCKH